MHRKLWPLGLIYALSATGCDSTSFLGTSGARDCTQDFIPAEAPDEAVDPTALSGTWGLEASDRMPGLEALLGTLDIEVTGPASDWDHVVTGADAGPDCPPLPPLLRAEAPATYTLRGETYPGMVYISYWPDTSETTFAIGEHSLELEGELVTLAEDWYAQRYEGEEGFVHSASLAMPVSVDEGTPVGEWKASFSFGVAPDGLSHSRAAFRGPAGLTEPPL